MKKKIKDVVFLKEDPDEVYCKTCKGCGYIGCDGVRAFLAKHVKGKTNCLNEESFIEEIISYVERK